MLPPPTTIPTWTPAVREAPIWPATNAQIGVTERLLHEADLGVPLLELALDDLRPDVLGLLLGGLVRQQGGVLRLQVRGGDPVHVHVCWGEAGDLDCQVVDQLLELLGPRDEVRLAVDFDEDADAPARMDVAGDEAIAHFAVALPGGCRLAALAQEGNGLVDVTVRLLQCALAVHESCAGEVAQALDVARGEVRHEWVRLLSGSDGGALAAGRAGMSEVHSAGLTGSIVAAASAGAAVAAPGRSASSSTSGSNVRDPPAASCATRSSAEANSSASKAAPISGSGSGSRSLRAARSRPPSIAASAISEQSSRMARIASSLPGMM